MTRHVLLMCLISWVAPLSSDAAWIWVEGEKPVRTSMHRHPYWYDLVKRDQLSGGDLISNFAEEPGEATYRASVTVAGSYDLWVRINPIQSKLSYKLNNGEWVPINLEAGLVDSTNIAADGKPDLRFLAWANAGKVSLKKGENLIQFRMDSPNKNHGYLDCFILTTEEFQPRGKLRPGQHTETEKGWFAFDPKADTFRVDSAIDLRFLNEKVAGQGGQIIARGSQFVHSSTGESVRFWGVNGPSGKDREALKREARILAKRGVNLVRIHHACFDAKGDVDLAAIHHAIEIVETMKAEGIYSHFSIYFPLWLDPAADNPWLKGYNGKTHAFASLYFNPDFQAQYRSWWKALLTTPSRTTGQRLIDDPAVFGAEIINEDSYFFWTFNDKNIPDSQLRLVETQFANWLTRKHGSVEAAFTAWNGLKIARDQPEAGRVGFRPLWNIAHEKTLRDQDTTQFLLESQRGFYQETYKFLKSLGFKGLITASNWTTASPEVFGPLEKYSYVPGDFIDRHGYFGGRIRGEASEWSIRNGHTYSDRSALRFESEDPGKAKTFAHPTIDPSYDNKPSMISETTWTRPNRYRTEAPLFYAAYGALQGSDAIIHFADDGANWSVKPGFFMQPWTLMSPAMMGQFPAAALIYRKGLVAQGDLLINLNLRIPDLLNLKGTPLPQDAAFDELRLKDVPKGSILKPGNVIDPLVHFAGRTNVNFTSDDSTAEIKDLSRLIDRKKRTVTSSTGELRLDYDKGLLRINSPTAQGISGNLKAAGLTTLPAVSIASSLPIGHVILVALDGKPLQTSQKMLLQVMSEEQASGFKTESAGTNERRILDIGRDPWLVREIEGTVQILRSDADRLNVTTLNFNGEPVKKIGDARKIQLAPSTTYYLITR